VVAEARSGAGRESDWPSVNPFKAIARGVTAPVRAVKATGRLLTIRARGQEALELAEQAEADPHLYRDPTWWSRTLRAAWRLLQVLPVPTDVRNLTMLKNVLANWQTTLAGIAALTAVAAHVAQDPTVLTNPETIAAILVGIGLVLGKDASVTGVKK
jgi:hypothetical protein